jgi:hypothetical protein
MPQRHRNNVGWQAANAGICRREPTKLPDEFRTRLLAVKQQRRPLQPGALRGEQQGAQPCANFRCAWVGVGERPGGTHRGAGAAADA